MKRDDFINGLREHSQALGDTLLSELKAGEDMSLNLEAENSLYVRFNQNRVRQNTNVEQMVWTLQLQSNNRTVQRAWTLSGDFDADIRRSKEQLEIARREIATLPEDSHQVAMANNGQSSQNFRGKLPGMKEIESEVLPPAEGSDLAGIFCSGPVVTASRNSKGQDHWFATESFFMDYSLYSGPKAVKGIYADANWSKADWERSLQRSKNQLSLLHKPTQEVKPGNYRTFLAPGAASEMLGMLGWAGLSAAAYKQGQCPLKRLADGEVRLSPHFTVRENFNMGLSPKFNSLGEVADDIIPLVEKGEFKQLLTSSRTAKEFGLKGNAASEGEYPRAMEVATGSLQDADILKELGTGLYLSNLHYLNWSDRASARITGMTRYACFWVERGEIVGPIKDLRFDVSLFDALGANLRAVTSTAEVDPTTMTYGQRMIGGKKAPGLLIDGFAFTL